MTVSHILGYPRMGARRELKFGLEKFWRGEIPKQELLDLGAHLRKNHWKEQEKAGLSFVSAGDFAWYDHVLTTSLMLGVVPKRHHEKNHEINLDTLFKIARGQSASSSWSLASKEADLEHANCCNAAASDMTKWFNTNYHYLVPEFDKDQQFDLSWPQLFEEVQEALDLGYSVKPVLLGPISYLWLGTEKEADFNRLDLLPKLLKAYQKIITRLRSQGVTWLQIDEPILALELPEEWKKAFEPAYHELQSDMQLLLTTYFDDVTHQLDILRLLPVQGLHVDLSASPDQLDAISAAWPKDRVLSVGVVNGRNIWRCHTESWLERLKPLKAAFGERLWIGSSCSLLHSPVDLDQEDQLDSDVLSYFSFAKQKLTEITILEKALDGDVDAVEQCRIYSQPIKDRAFRSDIHNKDVQKRWSEIKGHDFSRLLPYTERAQYQHESLKLPLLPTTTIGSFPQTKEIRKTRSDAKAGRIDTEKYQEIMQGHIADAISRQEALGLDVLVHGEAERNDMVEYFAEYLQGFVSTRYGWVQSYGSRCVKPAIVVGDIWRKDPITVEWSSYAQSLSSKPVKGMLTGPVTIMAWTFPREDVSRQVITEQIALALKDEVEDLQKAGIHIIQIDEPALREGMPLKKSQGDEYLNWAVNAFKISASVAAVQTQIHTHMCYSEFNEIIEAIAELDADVITIETSRSDMVLLEAFENFNYPNEIGPGVYDIHSPNVPSLAQIEDLLEKARSYIPISRLWVNPDCGLKTRQWPETEAALANMVKVAQKLRVQWQDS